MAEGPAPTAMRPFVCALCGFPQRSVYSLPGETGVKFCSGCFFREPIAMDIPSPAPTEPWGDDEEVEWEDGDLHVDEVDRVEPFVDDERKWMER